MTVEISPSSIEGMSKYSFDGDLLRDHHVYSYVKKHWEITRFLGVPILKTPADMMVLHDAIWSSMPDLIIETGTYYGGSALWMAHILDALGQGTILTCDRMNSFEIPKHRRIRFIHADSTDEKFLSCVRETVKGHNNVMVVLDSCHTTMHVFKELTLLAPFVTVGQYLVVEDTNLGGNPVQENYGPGPKAALEDWILTPEGQCFENDIHLETKYGYSYFPGGWLKRIREVSE